MRTAPMITDISSLARYILSSDCQSIVILTGAGMSTASGIPDFRSPGGMYDTLRPETITATKIQQDMMLNDPTQVVSWSMFQQNAFPYLEVRRPFILGTQQNQWKATIGHRFMELLYTKLDGNHNNKKKKLKRIYTQNIDGLDYQCTQIPLETIVPVHGTIRSASCEGCYTDMDYIEFCNLVRTNIKDIYNMDITAPKESKPILCPNCHLPLVKPKKVLFGRSLPSQFWECMEIDTDQSSPLDLLFVIGTSLVVAPANHIVTAVPSTTLRVMINQNPVGQELGIKYPKNHDPYHDDDEDDDMKTTGNTRDIFLQGNCDEILLQLIIELGWLDDLDPSKLPEASAVLVQQAQQNVAYQKWF